LGTNPLSLAAPGLNGDSFVLDMATSAVAMGKIEMKNRTNSAIPSQWLDPDTGALHPLGGDESNSSYKGYGLVVLVEILCGILSGTETFLKFLFKQIEIKLQVEPTVPIYACLVISKGWQILAIALLPSTQSALLQDSKNV
jgi:hypothetical protein